MTEMSATPRSLEPGVGSEHIHRGLPSYIHSTHTSSGSELGSESYNAGVSKTDVVPDQNLLSGVNMDPAQGIGTKTTCVLGWGQARRCGDMVASGVGGPGEPPKEALEDM